jgi:hypothetical protein
MARRAARLDARSDCGLCSIVDLSNGGMLVDTPIALNRGDPVRISFDCTNCVQGRVAWTIGGRAGIRFLFPLASAALLAKVAKDRLARSARPPQLTLNCPARVTHGPLSFDAAVAEISQQGLSLRHAGQLKQGAPVELAIAGGARVRGTVQWANRSLAEIKFDGMLTVEELSSKRGLAFIRTEPAALSSRCSATKWVL